MRGNLSASPNSAEPRHRVSSLNDEMNRRRFFRSKPSKDGDKVLYSPKQDWNSNHRITFLRLVFGFLILGVFLTLLHSPSIYDTEHTTSSNSRFSASLISRWRRDVDAEDGRYISLSAIKWDDVSKIVNVLTDRHDYHGIGLLNFHESEIDQWKSLFPDADHVVLNLESVPGDVTWETLYPEWIDEEEEFDTPTCPALPKLQFSGKPRLNFMAVKLPCNKSGDWARDVARLHLQHASAGLAATSKGSHDMYILLLTECFPIPNLFTCKELILHEGSAWLFKPNLNTLREKLNLPVGSCELSVPLKTKEHWSSPNAPREAYATVLVSAHVYVCGAIAVAQSIRKSGSTRDLVILVDETVSEYHREGLEAAGWKIRTIERIRNPKAERDAYNEWNYSKFRLWQLTDYDKIIFIDADLLILRNIDFLFQMPEITAIGNNATLFNSGVMVIEPSNCTFQLLMDHINEIESYNGGDQGYLNEIFTWWHRIPKHMNFLKHFWMGDEDEVKKKKIRLFGADPPVLYVIHFLGLKPWICFRDYDCNWNVDILQEFASDVAHKTWWKIHDAMPENLHKYCLLRSKQKAALEWDRQQAEKANYSDGHWKIKIQDPRLNICFEKFCFWESMLWHWGDKNWTDNANATTSTEQPANLTASLSSL